MKRNRFSEEQIIGILKEHEAGVSVADLCQRRHHLQRESQVRGARSLGGQAAEELMTLEDENTRLKRLLADAMLDIAALKDLLERNGDARGRAECCRPSASCIRDEQTA